MTHVARLNRGRGEGGEGGGGGEWEGRKEGRASGKTTPVGFEPTQGDPIGLAGRRLSHSAKVSSGCVLCGV